MNDFPLVNFLKQIAKFPIEVFYDSILMYLEQMTSWELFAKGSSLSALLERSKVLRLMRPQGTTEGIEDRQLDDRSSWVMCAETSMNQSSSNQGS